MRFVVSTVAQHTAHKYWSNRCPALSIKQLFSRSTGLQYPSLSAQSSLKDWPAFAPMKVPCICERCYATLLCLMASQELQ